MASVFEQIAGEYGIATDQLTLWVERRWIRPDRHGGEIIFTETDRARLGMIVAFSRDLDISEDAMPVVLDLLDRLHATRTRLRTVMRAVTELPEATRIAVVRQLRGDDDI
jgi:chaperone modulatory protein CbpM